MENMEEKEVTQEVEQPVQDDNGNQPITLDQYRKFMSLLAYFSALVLVPLICMFKDPVVRKHANNGLVLFIIEFALFFFASIFTSIPNTAGAIIAIIFYILMIFPLIFTIIGIVYVAKDMRKEVPIIGKMKILK